MNHWMRKRIGWMVIGLACVVVPAWASDEEGKVTIIRDEWGVPHIFAATDGDAAYGLGYAQAEDRLGDLHKNVRTAIGRMSEAFGSQYITQDYAMRMVKNAEVSKGHWDTLPPELQVLGEKFMAGVMRFSEENPDAVPEWAVELEPWHPLAIGRAILLNWPLGTIQDDLRNRENSTGASSNQWAVAPSRSADGSAILLMDPHLTWEGLAVFYEAHVLGNKLEMHGFFLVGVPIFALGHNANVGWAATTGGPDTSDVYELTIDGNLVPKYIYNDEWHSPEMSMITIPVKGQEPVTRPAAWTELGPVMADPDRENKKAYVGASPYFEEGGLFEQFYAMATAQNADEFYDALGMNQYMEQNIMYADTEGNIGYVRTGRVPIRPGGHDWSRPVPAVDSSTGWQGIHPIADLVQLRNPPQGYMQNCNISPQNMLKDSPLTPDKYPEYIYNVSWDYNNTRGIRTVQLLDKDDSVTKEEAMAYAFDVYDIRSAPWQEAIMQAVFEVGQEKMKERRFRQAVETIAKWDGKYTVDTEAGPIMKHLHAAARNEVDLKKVIDMEPLLADEQEVLLEALEQTLEKMEDLYGTTEIAWGDIQKLGRGDTFVPVPGVNFGGRSTGSRTLLSVSVDEDPEKPGYYIAKGGSMSMMLMFFRPEGVESYSCVMWGQSSDPESEHFMNQGAKLYSQRTFKPTWTKKEDLMEHVGSEKVLSTS